MNLIQFTGNVWSEPLNSGLGYRFTGSELIKLDWGVFEKYAEFLQC